MNTVAVTPELETINVRTVCLPFWKSSLPFPLCSALWYWARSENFIFHLQAGSLPYEGDQQEGEQRQEKGTKDLILLACMHSCQCNPSNGSWPWQWQVVLVDVGSSFQLPSAVPEPVSLRPLEVLAPAVQCPFLKDQSPSYLRHSSETLRCHQQLTTTLSPEA